jgi:hypothetical protein
MMESPELAGTWKLVQMGCGQPLAVAVSSSEGPKDVFDRWTKRLLLSQEIQAQAAGLSLSAETG